jgi:hypothetical protein
MHNNCGLQTNAATVQHIIYTTMKMKLTQDEAIALLISRETKSRFKGVTEGVSLSGMVSAQKHAEIAPEPVEDDLEGAS